MSPAPKPIFPIRQAAYREALQRAVYEALREDVGSGDVTTAALGLKGQRGRAALLAKEDGILAGADAFAQCFKSLDRRIQLSWRIRDGGKFVRGTVIAKVSGDAAAILTAERSALNFIAHFSGIATETAQLVARIPARTARLLDTRKTTPGLRLLEKRATMLGGAANHRIGLHDALMIKDNHTAAMGGLRQALAPAVHARRRKQLICEVTDLTQAQSALSLGATWLLLDNFDTGRLRRAVVEIRRWERRHVRRIIVEASGGITFRNIAAVANTGVDFISSGHITHSAPAIDFSLEWDGPPAAPRRA